MKKVLILIFIMFFSQNIIYAEDGLIWDSQKDEFIKELIQGKSSASEAEKQRRLDEELSKNLGINLIYTNLAECIKIAVDNNYNIKTKSCTKKQNYWENKNAKMQFLPDFFYGYTWQKLDGQFLVGGIAVRDVHEIALQSTFQLNWSTVKQGKLFFLNAQTRNAYNAANSTLEYTRDEVILQTTLTYYDLLSQKLKFEVSKSNLIDRTQQYKLIKARYEAGLENKYYVARADAEVAQAKQLYITSFNNLRLTQAKLANIMGIEILDAIYPYETSVESRELVENKYSIDSLYDMALVSRDDVRAVKLNIEALKAERSSTYMDFVPKMDITFASSNAGTVRLGTAPNTQLSVYLVAPLGQNLGLGTATKIKAYNSRIGAEQYKLVNLTRSVKESILGSYYDSKTALERVEAAKKQVSAADESVKISIVRTKIGDGTFTDVIAAQTAKVIARESLIQNVIEYNKAQAKLLFDSGIISVNSILKDYKVPQQTTTVPP